MATEVRGLGPGGQLLAAAEQLARRCNADFLTLLADRDDLYRCSDLVFIDPAPVRRQRSGIQVRRRRLS